MTAYCKVERKCKHCKKTVFVQPNQLRRGRGRFCSQKCYSAYCYKNKRCPRCKKRTPDNSGLKRHDSYCDDCRKVVGLEYNRSMRGRFRSGKKSAKHRGITWTLSMGDYEALCRQPCHYCGKPLPECGTGLDRKASEHGYVLGNVVPCCYRCNVVKWDHFTYEEMIELSKAIRRLDELRVVQTAA